MGSILLIDDNEDFRELFKISLSNAGIHREVLEAGDPVSALEIFNQHRNDIQIVVCDYYMPIQNGSDFLELVKSRDSSIFCCLLTSDEALVHQKISNVDKSFSKDNLLEVMKFLKNINWTRE